MEKIIHSLINNWIRGVDTYTHNGSTWLIFTESKKWVIELTEQKTLWYNYNFFKQIFEFTSLDVVENQKYITKWVEDNIINKVSDIHFRDVRDRKQQFEDTLENGVKEIKSDDFNVSQHLCEEVIDKGVKETKISPTHTEYGDWLDGDERLDEIIKNGVKETNHVDVMGFFDNKMEHTLENGIRLTECQIGDTFDEIDDIIENGVKETKTPGVNGDLLSTFQWMEENNTKSVPKMINDVLDNGVKKISPLDPEFSVRFIDGDENNDWEKVPNINEVIDNGVKETKHANRYDSIGPVFKEGKIENVIENGDKVSGTFVGGKRQKEDVESVIGYGILKD
jgi:predicted peroxiredoxin